MAIVIDQNPNNQFSTNFGQYSLIGFHGTTSLVCNEIETRGFLPRKIFSDEEHQTILAEARALKLDTFRYEEWLGMRSVTFTKDPADALAHIKQGKSGGQGLGNIASILQDMLSTGSDTQKAAAKYFNSKIQEIQNASSVIYAVDLSQIGQRLVQDRNQPSLFQVYFNPAEAIPNASVISPEYIIARLDIV